MLLSSVEAERILKQLGATTREGDNVVVGYVVVEDLKTLVASFPTRQEQIPEGIAHRFRKALCLDLEQFERLRSGRMGRNEYVQIVKRCIFFDENH